MRFTRSLLTIVLSVVIAPVAFAELADERGPGSGGPDAPGELTLRAVPGPDDDLFIGTGAFGGSVANPAFTVDVAADTSTQVFSGVPVWGAAYDPSGNRILFTTSSGSSAEEGANLYSFDLGAGTAAQVDVITYSGSDIRIDGLAFLGGTLYGVHQFDGAPAGAGAGIYEINTSTWESTFVLGLTSGAVSGLAGDTAAGLLYGPNDTTGQVMTIDPVAMTTGTLTAYPAAETDIDGAAYGDGMLYLVPDDDSPGEVFVYDVTGGSYTTSLSAPWIGSDTFSAGAYFGAGAGGEADLSLSMTVAPSGGSVVCTVTVTNLGPNDASGVMATVDIPPGLSYSSDSCGAGAPMGSQWAWNVGSLANGGNVSCSVTLAPSNDGPWTLVGAVSHSGTDPNPSNDVDTRQATLDAPVPTVGHAGIAILVLALVVIGVFVIRRAN